MTDTDTAPVTAVLDRLTDAWNAGDAAAYAAEFTPDATYVVFTGDLLEGRQAVEDTHRWLFQGPLAGSRMTSMAGEGTIVRFLRPDVAHVVAGGAVAPDGGEATSDRASRVSFVLVDDGDAWRVAAFQNTRVQPAGPPPR